MLALSAWLLNPVAPAVVLSQASDTTIIRVHRPRHQRVELIEELTLGQGRSGPEYLFTSARVHLGRDGSIYVIDPYDLERAATVRLYDSTGRFVRAIGRNGEGPGEYRFVPGDIKELPDGRILVSDRDGVLVYSPAGRSLGRWVADAPAAGLGSPILIVPSGLVMVYGRKGPNGERYVPRGATPVPFLYRFRLDGTLVDSVPPPEFYFPQIEEGNAVQNLFSPWYRSVWNPRGFFVTLNTGHYAVDLLRPMPTSGSEWIWRHGDPVVSIRRDSVPVVRMHPEERADWRHYATMSARRVPSRANWQWTGPELPSAKPPIRDLHVADDGRIWVRLWQPARLNASIVLATRPPADSERHLSPLARWPEAILFDVFESTGEYLGQVPFPAETQRFASRGNTVWVVVGDPYDVPIVKRYSIHWGG